MNIEKELKNFKNTLNKEKNNWEKHPNMKASVVLLKTLEEIQRFQNKIQKIFAGNEKEDLVNHLSIIQDYIINNRFDDGMQVFQQVGYIERKINKYLLEKTAA